MRGVRVHNTEISTTTRRIFTCTTVTFGLLMALVFLTAPNSGRITGYSVLVIVIGLYLRFSK